MTRLLLAVAAVLVLATPAMAQYYPPGPPVFVRPGPPPGYGPPPAYYRPAPRFTCFVWQRYGGGTCLASRYARPGDRCGCSWGPGRVG